MTDNLDIEALIKNSFKELLKIGEENAIKQNAESRLIFPKKRDGEKRISEQELRFLLARELEKQDKFYYSVEAPTEDIYVFSGKKLISARLDLCLYDLNGKRTNLIELKYDNVEVENDFLKLLCDSETKQNYFVHIVDNTDRETIPSIEEKYKKAVNHSISKRKIKSCIKIFLFVINTRSLYECKISNDGKIGELSKL